MAIPTTVGVERTNISEGTVVKSLGSRRRGLEQESGFTLIELMVVIVIIAVLLLIAIPSLFGARERANASAAKQRASTALKTQMALAADAKGYVADIDALNKAETSVTFQPLPDGAQATEVAGVVYFRDVSADAVTVVARADGGGACYWAKVVNGETFYAKGTCKQSEVNTLVFGSKWP